MKFLSVCSGLEGASLAFESLGWECVGVSEIENFPSAIIAHHYPNVRNFGDFTAIDLDALGAVDVLVGGTPCQAFSIAGKRLSLADARGNLSLAYVVLAHELARSHGLRNAIWENVPGVLNTDDNAFGCFLGALVGHDSPFPQPYGAGWPGAGMADGPRARCAWRVLDAQYFGLAQRRERVFVVADFGNGADPAEVLFERAGLRGNPAPRRETGKRVADAAAQGFGGNRSSGALDIATAVRAKGGTGHGDFESETFIAHTLRGEGFDAGEDGTGRGTPIVPVVFQERGLSDYGEEGLPTIRAKGGEAAGGSEALIAFTAKDYGGDAQSNLSPTLRAGGFTSSHANAGVMPAIAFAQNTRDEVRFQGDGDISGALAAEPGMKQQTYVAFQTHGSNIEHGGEVSGTLQTNSDRASGSAPMVAQAYDMRGREGGAQFEGPHDTANIRAASGGSSRSYVAQAYGITADAIDRSGEGAAGNAAERSGFGIIEEQSPTLRAKRPNVVATQWAVRRLTPTECERLQGVPDGHTDIPWRGKLNAPDGPRYKALGNSWAVPVVNWIGRRIDAGLK